MNWHLLGEDEFVTYFLEAYTRSRGSWLAKQARAERVSMSEIVRRAVDRLRADYERTQALTEDLQQAAGIWKGGDGLDWQNHLRDEWKER